MDVIKKIPHRHFVFSIPKILRRYFLGACPRPDRGIGSYWPIPAFARTSLSLSAWESLKVFLQDAVGTPFLQDVPIDPVPGAVIAVQTFGDFGDMMPNRVPINPHLHILVTDGCFYGDDGMFRVSPPFELKKLEAIFRHNVLRMLLNKRKITQKMIAMLSTWRYSGFNGLSST